MSWYFRVQAAINSALPELLLTQKVNLALLVSAILKKRTLCLSELARAYPTPKERRVPCPKHDLLHRLKRLWRFTDNERIDALRTQLAFVPHTIARLGYPRLLGLAIDWTMFDTTLPSGEKMRYQVLRIAVPRKGRALPLLQLAYEVAIIFPLARARTNWNRRRFWPSLERCRRACARLSWQTADSGGRASSAGSKDTVSTM